MGSRWDRGPMRADLATRRGGLYVFHFPIMRYMGRFLNAGSVPTLAGSQLPGQLLFTAVTGSVTVAAAVLSWHFYEARFLKWKALFH